MSNRNNYRDVVINDSDLREKLHDSRDREEVEILTRIPANVVTTEDRRSGVTHKKETFNFGTKMYKLAHKYYGSVDYWWIIAWYNNKATDAHFKVGDPIFIPLPLDRIITIATRGG